MTTDCPTFSELEMTMGVYIFLLELFLFPPSSFQTLNYCQNYRIDKKYWLVIEVYYSDFIIYDLPEPRASPAII